MLIGEKLKRPNDSLTISDYDPILTSSIYKGLDATYHKQSQPIREEPDQENDGDQEHKQNQ